MSQKLKSALPFAAVGWGERREAQRFAWNKNCWASFFTPTYEFVVFLDTVKIVLNKT